MAHFLDRRSFLIGSAKLAAASALATVSPFSLRSSFAAPATTLSIERRVIDVKGRAASVFGIRQPDGTHGVTLEPGELFNVDLANRSGEETIIHWHGQTPAFLQDGVAEFGLPRIPDGDIWSFEYIPRPGTTWMHSHAGLQEQLLLAAPLVVRTAEDARADVQEVTILLHDFSFRQPEEIFAELTGGGVATGNVMDAIQGMAGAAPAAAMPGHDMANMGAAPAMPDMGGMAPMPGMGGMAPMPGMGEMAQAPAAAMGGMPMDLNDVVFDAFLANDRTLEDPLVVRTERGGRVRLRIINSAASTNFWIDLGALNGTVIAVDGNPVAPVSGSRFPLAMAQRLDILVDVSEGAFPILAQAEGLRDRTGIVLATPEAPIAMVSSLADAAAGPVDLSFEARFAAAEPLAARPIDANLSLALTGAMTPFVWSVDGRTWPNVRPLTVRQGQRVAIQMRNDTMMSHPMHLHGHHFQVVGINGAAVAGPVRDTVLVPPMSSVTVAFDADNPGRWLLHCHNIYHMAAGMMTAVVYDNQG